MKNLTDEQIRFLRDFNIPMEKVINGEIFTKSDCIALMKDFDYEIAFGVSPCKKEGHTLRWRSWHCAQCNTHNRIFQKRHMEEGLVYVAFTPSGGLTKVGVCNDIQRRHITLNEQRYGGYDDWQIYKKPQHCVSDAGKIESLTHNKLKAYSIKSEEFVDFRLQRSNELFQCSPAKAYAMLLTVYKEHLNSIKGL